MNLNPNLNGAAAFFTAIPNVVSDVLTTGEMSCNIAHPFSKEEREKCYQAYRESIKPGDTNIYYSESPKSGNGSITGGLGEIPTWGWLAIGVGIYYAVNQ